MGFLSKIRNNMRKEISRIPSREKRSVLTGLRIPKRRSPLEDMITSGRLPQPSIGDMRFRGGKPRVGGSGRSEFFLRGRGLKIPTPDILRRSFLTGLPIPKRRNPLEDLIAGERLPQPIPERMSSVDDGKMYAGGSPGLYKPGGRFYNPEARLIMPQPIPRAERMPVSNAPSFNPTIFGQPIGDMDFSQMPKVSPEDIMNLQVPTDMPMTQDLPEVAPVGMMPQMRMDDMQDMEPRMMMQEGDEVSPEQELFSLQAQLKNLEEQLRLDRSYNDDQAVINTSAEMAAIQKRMKEIMEGKPQLKDGGDFPDLTGDGKVTQADILKGRGVQLKAEGGEMMMEETEMMAPSGDEIEASLMEVQDMQPEMQALDQFVQMVIEMVQAGASEAEVIESLRQAGLDDDDIAAVFQAVMETMQGSMEQGGIDAELAQIS